MISVARFPQSKGHGIGFNLVKEMFSYLNSLSELGYEIGNILAGSYLSALSNLTNLMIIPDVPALAIDMAGAILSVPAIEFGKTSDTVLYIENVFTDGCDSVIGDLFLVPDDLSYGKLLEALGVV